MGLQNVSLLYFKCNSLITVARGELKVYPSPVGPHYSKLISMEQVSAFKVAELGRQLQL